MELGTNNKGPVTGKLGDDKLWDLSLSEQTVEYRPVPNASVDPETVPVWRVHFDPTFDPNQRFGLDINGEIMLGRVENAEDVVSLNVYNAEELGVSRRHVSLRPTDSKLYICDMGSTNGTLLNGRSIGVNTPYSLANGDLLTLGKLEFVVRIVGRPTNRATALHSKTDLADALLPMARAITSQLTVEEVLKQTLELTIALTEVDEASIWLVDEKTGELFLEADRGIADEQIRHMRLSVTDTLAGKVIETGKPVHVNRTAGGDRIKVKTGYLVDAVIYVPLALGGMTFGVLSAAHRATGKSFGIYDERTMTAIADFTAIAVQNARVYEATKHALACRDKVLAAFRSALSYNLKKMLNSSIGYAGLLKSFQPLDDQSTEIVESIVAAGDSMGQLVDQLIGAASLSELATFNFSTCELVDSVARAVEAIQPAAAAKSIDVDFQLMGEPYLVQGDDAYLCRSVLNLLDNAVKFSPEGAKVAITLVFSPSDIIIRVRDTGPGIPEDQLPDLFLRFFRSKDPATGQGGLGLGLELVRATVEAHRGTLVAHNMEQGGAEFMITLPNSLRQG